MKVAILLVGNVRTWSKCKSNFLDTFGGLNHDIFVSTYNMQYGYHPAVKSSLNINEDFLLSNDEIISLFKDTNLRNINIEDTEEIANHINIENDKFHETMKNIHSCYGQYRKLKNCLDMMKLFEDSNQIKYNFVIKTRCDTIHNKFNFDFKENEVIISSKNCFPNDWIIVAERDSMIKISDFIINEFYNPIYEDSNNTPPHGLLHNAFKHYKLNIVQKDINSCVVRANTIQYY